MKKIIEIEIYKIFKSKKNIVIILLLFLYIIGLNFYNYQKHNEYMKKEYQVYNNKRLQLEGILGHNTRLLEKKKDLTIEEKGKLEQRIEFLTVEKNKLLVIESGYKENEPDRYNIILIAENDRYKNIIKGLNEGVITEDFIRNTNLDMQEIQKKIYLNQYILDNEIRPILNPYTMTGSNALVMFLEGNNLLILMFFLVLLSIDIYLLEIEEGSYKLLYNQPYERKKIFFGKMITILLVSLLLIILIAMFNFVIVTLVNGIGDMNYPFIKCENIKKLSLRENPRDIMIIPLWEYVIRGFGLLVPIIFFTIALVISISIFTDSSTKTLGISIILLVLLFMFNNFVSSQSTVNLIYPYSYLYMRDVIETRTYSNYAFGILLNTILTISLFIVSYYKFIGKDLLGAKE